MEKLETSTRNESITVKAENLEFQEKEKLFQGGGGQSWNQIYLMKKNKDKGMVDSISTSYFIFSS